MPAAIPCVCADRLWACMRPGNVQKQADEDRRTAAANLPQTSASSNGRLENAGRSSFVFASSLSNLPTNQLLLSYQARPQRKQQVYLWPPCHHLVGIVMALVALIQQTQHLVCEEWSLNI